VNEPMVEYSCGDECGTKLSIPATQSPPGWEFLAVRRMWRCPDCARALAQVNQEKQE
jgi:rubredoxin